MRKKPKIKSHGISLDFVEKFRDLQVTKIPGFFYLGIFQKLKSRDFWSRDFLIPGLSRDIPEPGYPAHTISAIFVFFTNNPWIYGLRIS